MENAMKLNLKISTWFRIIHDGDDDTDVWL